MILERFGDGFVCIIFLSPWSITYKTWRHYIYDNVKHILQCNFDRKKHSEMFFAGGIFKLIFVDEIVNNNLFPNAEKLVPNCTWAKVDEGIWYKSSTGHYKSMQSSFCQLPVTCYVIPG